MCGIFGARWSWLSSLPGDPQRRASAALQALRWRGPDGLGQVRCGDFVLGCARLAITEPRSRQPVVLRGGRFAAVMNGAVTDARARWSELDPRLRRRRTLPNDAWLPLLLCRDGRIGALERLCGHRAAAVVDADADRLWLLRDPCGEKPLLVALLDGAPVAFASTAAALRALGVDVDLDAAAVRRLFAFGTAGPPVSASAGIGVDPSLRGVTVASGRGAALQRWAPTAAASARADGTAVAPSAPGLGAALRAAVQRCADVDQPLALCLSGGRDSSCIAALLPAAADGPRAGYQFCADGADGGEREVAAAVAAHCGLRLRAVGGGPELLDLLPALTRVAGGPLGDPSVLALHAVARAAAADGVRVLLSGEGADEALLGYRRHRALRWVVPPRLPLPRGGWSLSPAARLRRAFAAEDPYAALLAVAPPAFLGAVFGEHHLPTLPRSVSADANAEPLRPRGADARLRRALAVDAGFYLRWDLLPKLDVATMAAGVEGRCPFLDPAVQAACAALPPRQRLGKRPLQAAFAAVLPVAVWAQPKRGMAVPLDRWFRGELSQLDLLREPRTRQRPHLRPSGLDRAIDRHRRGGAALGHALYLVLAYELYLRSREEVPACG